MSLQGDETLQRLRCIGCFNAARTALARRALGEEGVQVARTFWEGRRVLVTGHTGFKGAWLSLWLEHLGADVVGLALPPESPRGARTRMQPWSGTSLTVDLRDAERVATTVRDVAPEIVLHLAAEAIVRRGYRWPTETFATNVMGTIHLLEAIRAATSVTAVLVVTSDKVYADATQQPAVESDRLGHPDPYSGSKACTEIVVATWRESYLREAGIAIATARAGNVIGGGDDAPDRLVPDLLRAHEAGQAVVLRSPDSVRPWQHVLDPLHGYLRLTEALADVPGTCPEAVNFGPVEPGWPVERVVRFLHDELWSGRVEIQPDPSTPEAPALLLDSALAGRTLGWQPMLTTTDALRWTAAWFREASAGGDMRAFSLQQVLEYESRIAGRAAPTGI
jgi:CDP-glucose 4,6-dehydratase